MSPAIPIPLSFRPTPPEPQRDAEGHIIYPDSDGLPVSNNTVHLNWITFLLNGFQQLFSTRKDVFVAGDLLWYPTEGRPDIRVAPDLMIAFGRPPGPRGSYRQWDEGGIAPQVVFEIISPCNSVKEMTHKLDFFNRHGVQEYYVYDHDEATFEVWLRGAQGLELSPDQQGYISQLLGTTFWLESESGILHVELPDGKPMLSYEDQCARAVIEQQRAEEEKQRAEEEKCRAEEEKQRADAATQRAEALAQKLRELGIEP